jgi:hypothetical protein
MRWKVLPQVAIVSWWDMDIYIMENPSIGSIPGNIVSQADSSLALGYFYAATRHIGGFDGIELVYMREADTVQYFS